VFDSWRLKSLSAKHLLGPVAKKARMNARKAAIDRSTLSFLAALIGVCWLRVQALLISPLNLHFDEAQYWAWSQTFEWGYFSKPPLVAWAIAATTALFGDAEWAVRVAAPIAQGVGALLLFALGRNMYGAAAGFWAGLGWLLLPAVWLSSGIISTDALLLPFWSLALLATWRLIVTRDWVWAITLGLAVGIGALAKYAMLYFVVCAALASLWSKPARAVLWNVRGAVAAVIALAVLGPNLAWNFTHGFATIEHTAANARLTADFINPNELLEFLGSQALVIGPILFVVLIWLFWRAFRRADGLSDEDKFLLAFILPPLAVIMAQAFLSRANANWAATAYPAAIVWIAGNFAGTRKGVRVLAAAMLLNLAIGGTMMAAATDPVFADRIGFANGLKRSRGWEETAREIATRALGQPEEPPFTAVLVDHRATYFELAYYWRHARRSGAPLPPVRMWLLHDGPRNSAEAVDPMRPEEGARVLVVHANPGYLPLVAGDFTVFRSVEHLTIPLGGGINRELEISVGEGFAPAPRDAAFEERLLQGGS
jgi:Dolichyl-phosphate-mannose-protein mannosyltransferase